MKKKIINGIMMVALVAATSTSFVSCKDTNEDVKIEQDIKLSALQSELDALESQLDDLDGKYGDLNGKVSTLQSKATELEGSIGDNADAIKELAKEVDELELWLVETFAKLVTSVEISGTYNNMLGSVNIPGFEPKMLINNWGKTSEANTAGWPKNSEKKIYWGASEELGTAKDDDDFQGFAGYIYANINRYIDDVPVLDKDAKGFFNFSLVNTAGEKADGVVIKNFDEKGGPTKDVLQWGWTRADNNIYKFAVAYNGEKASNFQPTKINLSLLKEDLKAIWRDRNRQTGTSKQSLGHLVADLYYNVATRDTNMKKYALKVAWTDNEALAYEDENGDEKTSPVDHMVTSEAELVFATIQPLSFESGPALIEAANSTTKKVNNFIEKAEPYIDRILNRIKSRLNIDKYYLDETAFDNIKTDANGKYVITITQDQLNNAGVAATKDIDVDVDDIVTPMEQSFGKVNTLIDDLKNVIYKVNGTNIGNWVEKFTNKANQLFNNHADQMLQPTLLAINKDGVVNRVSGIENMPYEAEGEITLKPTTYTAELFAPAYAKFVGCEDIKEEGFNEILYAGAPTKAQELKFTPEKGKLYKIVYEAVDFFGNTREHTYYIQGK